MNPLRYIKYIIGSFLIISLAGCTQASPGGESGGELPPERRTGVEQTLECTPGQEHWLSKDPPKRGGIYQKTGATANLDPTAGSGVVVGQMGQVYNTLLEQRSCFFEDIEVAPSLVKSWDISRDGL